MVASGIAERGGGTTSFTERIPGGLSAPATARELLTGALSDSTQPESMHDALLLTTELVTNAVRHAHVDENALLELRVVATPAMLRIAVTDPGGHDAPRVQELDVEVPGGMGLFLVEQISRSWGVERVGAGENRVWFELPR